MFLVIDCAGLHQYPERNFNSVLTEVIFNDLFDYLRQNNVEHYQDIKYFTKIALREDAVKLRSKKWGYND